VETHKMKEQDTIALCRRHSFY